MQKTPLFCSLAAIAILAAAGAVWLALRPPVSTELPSYWSLAEIEKETPPYATPGRVYVLAWKIVEDESRFRVESCLVMKVLDEHDGHSRWCLAHLYRHPMGQAPKWQLSMMHVSGEEGTIYYPGLWILHAKTFKDRPGNKELYAALSWEGVYWSFEPENDPGNKRKIVSCVCEKSWQEAIGEPPPRSLGLPRRGK